MRISAAAITTTPQRANRRPMIAATPMSADVGVVPGGAIAAWAVTSAKRIETRSAIFASTELATLSHGHAHRRRRTCALGARSAARVAARESGPQNAPRNAAHAREAGVDHRLLEALPFVVPTDFGEEKRTCILH